MLDEADGDTAVLREGRPAGYAWRLLGMGRSADGCRLREHARRRWPASLRTPLFLREVRWTDPRWNGARPRPRPWMPVEVLYGPGTPRASGAESQQPPWVQPGRGERQKDPLPSGARPRGSESDSDSSRRPALPRMQPSVRPSSRTAAAPQGGGQCAMSRLLGGGRVGLRWHARRESGRMARSRARRQRQGRAG